MNATEIAQFYTLHPYKRMQFPEQAALCRAVLDAGAYKKRVEGVAEEMLHHSDYGPVPRTTRVRLWAEQLTEKGDG